MDSGVLRTAAAAGVAVVLLFGVVTFFSGTHPLALIQRTWGRLIVISEPVRPGDTVLAVAFDRQDHALSCEVAALKMALAYRGVTVDEATLIAAVGTDPTPKQTYAGRTVWGDPNRAFVGSIDGRMLVDGYGVYWDPIARVGAAYRPTRVIENSSPAVVARNIAEGNPVLVWGFLGSGRRYSWVTPEGKSIPAVLQEHVYVAYGFRGPPDEPQGFFLMDPIYGSRYEPVDEFLRVWGALDYSGVIIY